MDKKIENAIEPLIKMYEEIENDLLKIIASHFSMNDEFLNSDYWRIKKLEEMGLFNQKIVQYLAQATNKIEEEIIKELNKIGIDTIDMPKLESLFENGNLKINPVILQNNYTIQNIIKMAYNELSNRFIELSQKIEQSTRNAYLDIVEQVYLKTTMGTHSYQEAIRESINDLSNSGIKTLTYKTTDGNGNIVGIRNYDIEGTVRREVLTSARKLSNDINMEVANKLESEYIYLSEHLQCRPKHFDWQGTIIKRKDLAKVTHYGEIDGLAGINCRHYFEAYFGDARGNDLKHFNKEECEKAYELSQHQRYLERGVRKWKRKTEMFKTINDNESYNKCQKKVKEWQLRTKDFTEANKLKRDFAREYVSQSNINNRIFEDEYFEEFEKLDKKKEHLIYYDLESGNIVGNVITGDNHSVQPNILFQLKLKMAKKDSMIAVHNHPSNLSFSLTDFQTFNNSKELKGIAVRTDEYIYLLSVEKGSKLKATNQNMDYMKKVFNKIEKDMNITRKNKNINNVHERNILFAKEMGWKYERVRNKK